METKKMNLANIQGKLSRAEMKNIMAGSGGGCTTDSFCNSYQSACWKAGYSGLARYLGGGWYSCCC